MILPPAVIALLNAKMADRWSGTIVLNIKEGRIVAYEERTKSRIEVQVRTSPPNVRIEK